MSVVTELMEAALKAPRKGLLAFHASPYEFDRFSNKYLMKGEGAMVRGSGHYSGSSLEGEVAPKYWTGRDTFIGPDPKRPEVSVVQPQADIWYSPRGERLLNDTQMASNNAYDLLTRGTRRTAGMMYQKAAANAPVGGRSEWIDANWRNIANSDDAYEEALYLLDETVQKNPSNFVYDDIIDRSSKLTDLAPNIRELLEGRRVKYNPGRGYALDLQVNPERYLDYNAPIDQQLPYVRDALLSSKNPDVRVALNPTAIGIDALRQPESGGQLLHNLERLFSIQQGFNSGKGTPAQALKAQNQARDVLMEHGLDYTKYTPLGGGEGTKRGVHYIVYDPKKIKILKMLSLAGVTWAADELRRMGMDNQLTEDTDVTSA